MKFGDEPTKQAIDPTKIGRYRYNFGWNGGTTPKNPSCSAGKSSANLGTWTCGECLNYNRWNICRSWDAVEALKQQGKTQATPISDPSRSLILIQAHISTAAPGCDMVGSWVLGQNLSQKTLPDVSITIYWICVMVLFLLFLWYHPVRGYYPILINWKVLGECKHFLRFSWYLHHPVTQCLG